MRGLQRQWTSVMTGAARFQPVAFDDFEEMLLDKPEDEKWELIGGRLVKSMVGARWEHHIIAQNILSALRNHIKATRQPCRVFQETFFLKSEELDLSVLPDVFVQCGVLEGGATSASDALVVVEVVSPSSEVRDRYEKWAGYKLLPALQHYVLVTRDRVHVEVKHRAEPDWATEEMEGLDRVLRLPAIGFSMSLAEVYDDVLGPRPLTGE